MLSGELYGSVHEGDTALRASCRSLGFVEASPDDGAVRVTASLAH